MGYVELARRCKMRAIRNKIRYQHLKGSTLGNCFKWQSLFSAGQSPLQSHNSRAVNTYSFSKSAVSPLYGLSFFVPLHVWAAGESEKLN